MTLIFNLEVNSKLYIYNLFLHKKTLSRRAINFQVYKFNQSSIFIFDRSHKQNMEKNMQITVKNRLQQTKMLDIY